ncbi:MAG: PaaI family thioesterase [Actinomycetota bacterium]|nr:PaaI family thioesterase [Actinomycetota bacterium]
MVTSRAGEFEPVDAQTEARWRKFAAGTDVNFPRFIGLQIEDVRHGYCRMRLPIRSEVKQAHGLMHGGALASLLDSVLVPAIGVTVPPGSTYSTVDLHVQFLDALRDEDAVAEGWVVRQGRRTVFGESEARAATSGRLVAKAVLTYSVRVPVIIA